ncbi:hypothetical protein PSOL_04880 [Candidatus Phytoplasma solani]
MRHCKKSQVNNKSKRPYLEKCMLFIIVYKYHRLLKTKNIAL